MGIKVSGEVAEDISKNIISKGEQFAEIMQSVAEGGNTGGIEAANRLREQTMDILKRYKAVVLRDGEQIDLLAQHFEEIDQEMGSQIDE